MVRRIGRHSRQSISVGPRLGNQSLAGLRRRSVAVSGLKADVDPASSGIKVSANRLTAAGLALHCRRSDQYGGCPELGRDYTN